MTFNVGDRNAAGKHTVTVENSTTDHYKRIHSSNPADDQIFVGEYLGSTRGREWGLSIILGLLTLLSNTQVDLIVLFCYIGIFSQRN